MYFDEIDAERPCSDFLNGFTIVEHVEGMCSRALDIMLRTEGATVTRRAHAHQASGGAHDLIAAETDYRNRVAEHLSRDGYGLDGENVTGTAGIDRSGRLVVGLAFSMATDEFAEDLLAHVHLHRSVSRELGRI